MTVAESVQLLKGIAEPNRLRILRALLKAPKSGTQLADELSAPQTRIARHLRYLRRSGWVRAQQQHSPEVEYSLSAPRHALHRDLLAVLSRHLPGLSA